MGKHVEELIVKECKATEFADCDIIFSGLDADVAGDIGIFSLFSGFFYTTSEGRFTNKKCYRNGIPKSRTPRLL